MSGSNAAAVDAEAEEGEEEDPMGVDGDEEDAMELSTAVDLE